MFQYLMEESCHSTPLVLTSMVPHWILSNRFSFAAWHNLESFSENIPLSQEVRLTEATSIAQSPCTIRSTTPFGSLGSVARMATTRRCCSSSPFLGFSTSKSSSTVELFQKVVRVFIGFAWGRLEILSIVFPLLSKRLLLSLDEISDPDHGVQNTLLLAQHLVTFSQSR